MRYTLDGRGYTVSELYLAATSALRRALLTVPGVVDVRACGAGRPIVLVQADPARLSSHGLGLGDVDTGLARAAPPSTVLGATAAPRDLHDLENAVLATRDGVPVRLRDVAHLEMASRPTGCVAMRDDAPSPVSIAVALADDRPEVRAAVRARLAAPDLLAPGMALRPFGDATELWRARVVLPPVPIEEAARTAAGLRATLGAVPEVSSVLAELRLPAGDAVARLSSVEGALPEGDLDLYLEIRPRDGWRSTVKGDEGLGAELGRRLGAPPGTAPGPLSGIGYRLARLDGGARPVGSVELYIEGPDLEALGRLADEAAEVLRALPGTGGVASVGSGMVPVESAEIDRRALARMGLQVADLAPSLEALQGGHIAGALDRAEGRREVLLVVPGALRERASSLDVAAPGGQPVRLASVVTVATRAAPRTVLRRDGRRHVVLRLTAVGRPPSEIVADARPLLDSRLKLPAGVSMRLLVPTEAR
jgi:Cu/Ag efflux pump CusA